MPDAPDQWMALVRWADFLWLPVAAAAVHRGHRIMACVFVLCCLFTMRLQVEIMDSIGRPRGLLGLLTADAFTRGLAVYGLAIGFFLVLAHYSRNTQWPVFITAAMAVYFGAFTVSSLVMTL